MSAHGATKRKSSQESNVVVTTNATITAMLDLHEPMPAQRRGIS
jgi:hypothetical protein